MSFKWARGTAGRAPLSPLFLLLLTLSILFVSCRTATARASGSSSDVVAASVLDINAGQSVDHLESLSKEDLKAILTKKGKKRVSEKHYKTRDDLMLAILEAEKEEARKLFLKQQMDAAVQWWKTSYAAEAQQRHSRRGGGGSSISDKTTAPHLLRVVYSQPSGYEKQYTELSQELQRSETVGSACFTNEAFITMEGVTFKEDPAKLQLSKLFKTLFYAMLVLSVGADFIPFVPAWLLTLCSTRKMLVISTAFFCKTLGDSFSSAGAFEVYLDGQLLHSTLKTAVLPSAEKLAMLILNETVLPLYTAAMSGAGP